MRSYLVHQVHKHPPLQGGCPIQVQRYRLAEDQDRGITLLQLRMGNRSDKAIKIVFLRVEAPAAEDGTVRKLSGVTFASCDAEPGEPFGEDRVIILPWSEIAEVRICVELVVFSDGQRWKERVSTSWVMEKPLCEAPIPTLMQEPEAEEPPLEEQPPVLRPEAEETAELETSAEPWEPEASSAFPVYEEIPAEVPSVEAVSIEVPTEDYLTEESAEELWVQEPEEKVLLEETVTEVLQDTAEGKEQADEKRKKTAEQNESQWWLWLVIGITSFAMLLIMYILLTKFYMQP